MLLTLVSTRQPQAAILVPHSAVFGCGEPMRSTIIIQSITFEDPELLNNTNL